MSDGLKPIRTYAVKVSGFDPGLYSARSPAKARARCYWDYLSYDSEMTFREFLKITSISRTQTPDGIGGRFMVVGRPATRVIDGGKGASNRLLFMRDDSDVVFSAHPSEVQEIEPIAAFRCDEAPAVRSEAEPVP